MLQHVTFQHGRRRRRPRRGSTLVELMGATMVCALVLVPSTRLLHRSHRVADRLALRTTLEHLAASEIHLRLARLPVDFTAANFNGSFAGQGHPNMRYATVCSDLTSDGGTPGQLMCVQTQVWHDANGDTLHQANEMMVHLATKYAKEPNV